MCRSDRDITLCWDCKNAVPHGSYGCSWSRHFAPVSGWTAARRDVRVSSNGRSYYTESYIVLECPEFNGGR